MRNETYAAGGDHQTDVHCNPGLPPLSPPLSPLAGPSKVTHSPKGKDLLGNFVLGICGAPATWNMADLATRFIESVRETVGPDGHVIGAVSGGVDSTVAAVLMHRAIGDRFHAILVDNGCLRKGESTEVCQSAPPAPFCASRPTRLGLS